MRISKNRFIFITLLALIALAFVPVLTSWYTQPAKPPAFDPNKASLNPDTEPDSIEYEHLSSKLGPIPKGHRKYQIAAILKFLGNQQWQWIADGMQFQADTWKQKIEIVGASTETDLKGQLSIMEMMMKRKRDAFLVSPQTDYNLRPAIERARKAGTFIVNVDGAVLKDAEHWVGSNHYQHGVKAARYFLQHLPSGGKVAVIKGLHDASESNKRTKGFLDALQGKNFRIVASPNADWDLQRAYEAAILIIRRYPDIKGFYCCNDIMALGVVEAVKKEKKLGKIIVIGTDGIKPAYDSILRGELTATVDKFPYLTGQIAVEVTQRLLGGQTVPRVVLTPQQLITIENIDHPLPSYSGMIHPVTK